MTELGLRCTLLSADWELARQLSTAPPPPAAPTNQQPNWSARQSSWDTVEHEPCRAHRLPWQILDSFRFGRLGNLRSRASSPYDDSPFQNWQRLESLNEIDLRETKTSRKLFARPKKILVLIFVSFYAHSGTFLLRPLSIILHPRPIRIRREGHKRKIYPKGSFRACVTTSLC